MKLNIGTIFPQEGKWYLVIKRYKKSVRIRELIQYKVGDKHLELGQIYKATIDESN